MIHFKTQPQMKHYLPILILIACCGQLFAQENSPASYEDLMQAYDSHGKQLVKAGTAVNDAYLAYASTVRGVVSEQTKAYGANTNSQVNWMAQVVPTMVVSIGDAKLQEESIEQWISAFCKAQGLTTKDHKAIRKELRAYAKAYNLYWTAYYQIRNTMVTDGSTPPPPPPPPPPAQQHH